MLNKLAEKIAQRAKLWDPEGKLSDTFHSTELAGEVGEACNIVKKLERERLGLKGSRATIDQLKEELADSIICVAKIAQRFGIDLEQATVAKFDDTSRKMGFPVFMGLPEEVKKAEPPFEHLPSPWRPIAEAPEDRVILGKGKSQGIYYCRHFPEVLGLLYRPEGYWVQMESNWPNGYRMSSSKRSGPGDHGADYPIPVHPVEWQPV